MLYYKEDFCLKEHTMQNHMVISVIEHSPVILDQTKFGNGLKFDANIAKASYSQIFYSLNRSIPYIKGDFF